MHHSTFPTEASLPESVELIHDHTTERIVGIRLASGAIFRVEPTNTGAVMLGASESTVSYTRTADAVREAADRVWDAEYEAEQTADKRIAEFEASMPDLVRDEADELVRERTWELEREREELRDTIRDLRDELEERQSRVEELCEQIAKLEARA